ncbi:Rossmann-like domain-containing protein [Methanothermobacter wolfeii]|uniref:Rossmann-like domain-containing protein n=1 Tax=Methanothermobacter wolfeii TaxID=145261 RepID=UPI0024B3C54F|nr:DUF364 domain-containing protein [Methanothermobacter wolfeii]MDI6703005.1 DUF364 domain-containing protein [Methanothermobacter wolfeii]
MLIEDIINDIPNVSKVKARIKDIVIGKAWTGVWSEFCGISYNNGIFKDFKAPNEVDELLELSKSQDTFYSSIGIATINSLLKGKGKKCNAFDILHEECKNRKVAMVGAFSDRCIDKLKAKKLFILEIDPLKVNLKQRIFPATAAEHIVPQVDVLIMTGSTLVTQGTESYLSLADKDAFVAIIGPSTPLTEVFFDYGVNMIAGIEIIDPVKVMEKIKFLDKMLHQTEGEIIYKVMEG